MNEQYMFRAKQRGGDVWLIGYLKKENDGFAYLCPINNFPNKIELMWYCVDPATIGQCTGLRDKNGVLIFEGDVCKDSLGWVFEVAWDDENARFIGRHSKPRGDTYICYVSRAPAAEIIGNMHDTPELLERSTEA